MRIKSNFKDYYDGFQIPDVNEPLFIRKKQVIELNKLSSGVYLDFDYDYIINYNLIGFCGHIYPFLHVYKSFDKKEDQCFYDIEASDCFFKEILSKKEWELFSASSYDIYSKAIRATKYKRYHYFRNNYNRHYIQKHFNNAFETDHYKQNKKYFDESPIFLKKSNEVVINPKLADYQFWKVKKNNIAFQEIQQWLSNIANPIKPIPKIDDKIMLEIKGFDKYSFKTPKRKK